jgi:hypothetical protein
VGAAPYFAEYNNRVFERFDDGRIHIVADDGRSHLLRTRSSYDVIISDSTHPATADSWVLYTREFYELCRSRLKPGGYVAQWLPLHGLTVDDYKMIVRTFHSVFPHGSLWLNARYSVLLGAPERLRIDYDLVKSRLESPALGSSLDEVYLGDPVSFLSRLALDEHAIPGYVGEGPINTDDRATISFRDRLRSDTSQGIRTLVSLLPHLPLRMDSAVQAVPSKQRALERRLRSRRHMFVATVALAMGDRSRAVLELRRAERLDPRNRDAERMLTRLVKPSAGRGDRP